MNYSGRLILSLILTLLFLLFSSTTAQIQPSFVFTGTVDDEGLGWDVAGAGDINADGYKDFIIGASIDDSDGSPACKAYVYLGGSTLDNIPDLVLTGPDGSYFGNTVSSAGDVNGDGFDDIIVGAYMAEPWAMGAACIYLGGSTPDNTPDIIIHGTRDLFWFALNVERAGDINGDGFGDILIIDYPGYSSGGVGQTYIFWGGATMDTIPDLVFATPYIHPAGDINSDGYDDLMNGNLVILGSASTDTSADVTLNIGTANGGRGCSIGDNNGDGNDDVAVQGVNGATLFFFGGDNADQTPDVIFPKPTIVAAGDVNGDGYDDVLSDGVCFGGLSMDANPDVSFSEGGYPAGVGDVNNDGLDDFLSGKWYWGSWPGVSRAGRAYLYLSPFAPPLNPGFESGISHWTFYTNGSGTFTSDGPPFAGAHSAHIGIVNQGTNVQLYQDNLKLEPNATYRITFRAYSTTGNNLSVSMLKQSVPYTSYGVTNQEVNLTPGWGRFNVEFTTKNILGPVADARLRFWFAPYDVNGDQYYIDNVSLYKISNISTPAPHIQTQPVSKSASVGEYATFALVATGTPPLSYQWQHNGVNIAGATNAQYTTSQLTLADTGAYRCLVSNAGGTVASNVAILTITPGNVVLNPSFDNDQYWTSYGTPKFEGYARGNERAARVRIMVNNPNMQLYQSGISLLPNTRYLLTFIAVSSTGHDLSVALHRHDAPYTSYGLNGRVFDLGTDWHQFSVEFTTSGFTAPVSNARLSFRFHPFATTGDSFFLDDIILRQVAPASFSGEQLEGADVLEGALPTRYELRQNYPNPFNPSTQFHFVLKEGGNVQFAVYDVLGRKVADLVNEYYDAGLHSTTWDGTGENGIRVSSGVYITRFTVTNAAGYVVYSTSNKVMLMK